MRARLQICVRTQFENTPSPLVHFSYTFGKPPLPLACVRLLWMPPMKKCPVQCENKLLILDSKIPYEKGVTSIAKKCVIWSLCSKVSGRRFNNGIFNMDNTLYEKILYCNNSYNVRKYCIQLYIPYTTCLLIFLKNCWSPQLGFFGGVFQCLLYFIKSLD